MLHLQVPWSLWRKAYAEYGELWGGRGGRIEDALFWQDLSVIEEVSYPEGFVLAYRGKGLGFPAYGHARV